MDKREKRAVIVAAVSVVLIVIVFGVAMYKVFGREPRHISFEFNDAYAIAEDGSPHRMCSESPDTWRLSAHDDALKNHTCCEHN